MRADTRYIIAVVLLSVGIVLSLWAWWQASRDVKAVQSNMEAITSVPVAPELARRLAQYKTRYTCPKCGRKAMRGVFGAGQTPADTMATFHMKCERCGFARGIA